MLLRRVQERNPALIEAAVRLHQAGEIPPNTWLYDLDAIAHNARCLAAKARSLDLTATVMTKQYCRNPMVTMVALRQGLYKAVAVDIHGAKLMHRYRVPIAHIGHLNQIPMHDVGRALEMRPDFITVYSVEAARRISAAAAARDITQDLLVRVYKPGDVFFAGQEGGFRADNLIDAARQIARLPNVRIVGVTSFPVLEYSFGAGDPVRFNPNMATITDAARRLRDELGLAIRVINAPGNTSVDTMDLLKSGGATHVEPGHGLVGTTPPQLAGGISPEIPAYVYVTEVSHHYEGRAYGFGGGLWTMLAGFMDPTWEVAALVGAEPAAAMANKLTYEHLDQIIDYHVSLLEGDRCQIGDTVVLPMYTQAQMTRSHVAPVSGIASGEPVVWGIFDHANTMLDDNYDPVAPAAVMRRIDELLERYESATVGDRTGELVGAAGRGDRLPT